MADNRIGQRDDHGDGTHELIARQLAERGVAHLPAHTADEAAFRRLTEHFCSRFTSDPAKHRATSLELRDDRIGTTTRKVQQMLDRGPGAWRPRRSNHTRTAPLATYGINPHNENSYIPGCFPDLVWFWCRQPAARGGETILVDGSEALAALPERAVDHASRSAVHYDLTFSATHWRNLYDVDSEAELSRCLADVDGLEWRIDRGRLSYSFDVPFIDRTRFDDRPTLRTNVLSRRPYDAVGDNEPEIGRDRQPMPAWFVEDLLAAVRATRTTLALDAGDVVVIDNHRVMHGRTPFTGSQRRVLTRCGFSTSGEVEPPPRPSVA